MGPNSPQTFSETTRQLAGDGAGEDRDCHGVDDDDDGDEFLVLLLLLPLVVVVVVQHDDRDHTS